MTFNSWEVSTIVAINYGFDVEIKVKVPRIYSLWVNRRREGMRILLLNNSALKGTLSASTDTVGDDPACATIE